MGVVLRASRTQPLLAEGVPLRGAVYLGSMERLNPVPMTALSAGLALIPLALAGGEPGHEIQSPMPSWFSAPYDDGRAEHAGAARAVPALRRGPAGHAETTAPRREPEPVLEGVG